MAQYQVVGAAAVVKINTPDGPSLRHYYPPAVLPAEADEESVAHLIDAGLVVEVGAAPVVAAEPEPEPEPDPAQ